MGDEGRGNENEPNDSVFSLHLEVFNVELTHPQQVLVEDSIDKLVSEDISDDLAVFTASLVHDQEGVADGHQDED